MRQAAKSTLADQQELPERGADIGGGWRIKERKAPHLNEPIGHSVRVSPDRSARLASSWFRRERQPRQRRFPSFVLLACAGAVLIALMIALPWFSFSGPQRPIAAEVVVSSAADRSAVMPQVTPDAVYYIHLGVYRSELGARLVWAGVEAYSGTSLEGLAPSFKRDENDVDGLYHLQVGTFERHEDAESHCAQLRSHNVVCSIVDS